MKDTLTYVLIPGTAPDELQAEVNDSIAEGLYSSDSVNTTATSLLLGHRMPPAMNGPETLNHTTLPWVFPLTIILLFVITLIRYNAPKKMAAILSTVISRAQANHYLRDSNIFKEQIFLPLLITSFIATGLFAFLVLGGLASDFPGPRNAFSSLIVITLALAVFYMLKVMLINLSGWIFKNREVTFEYVHNLFIFNIFTSVSLLPFILIIPVTSSLLPIYISLGMIFILFSIRFFRGLAIGMGSTKFSQFHLFLYLCTLEILPYLLVAKLAMKYIFSLA